MSSSDAAYLEMVEASQIKGFVFVTCARFVEATFSEAELHALLDTLEPDARAAFKDPEVSALYPEAYMHAFVTAMHRDLAGRDDQAFAEMIRGIARMGISKFFRLLLSLSSALFVVRRVPLLFHRLRSGPAVLSSQEADGKIVIRYENFPWCGDPVYRLTSMANIQAAAEATGAECPTVRVLRCDATSMDLEVDTARSRRELSATPVA